MATTASSGASGQPASPEIARPGWSAIEERLSRSIIVAGFAYIGEISILTARTLASIARSGINIADLFDQMFLIGVGTLPIALLTVFTSSAVISLYFSQFLVQYHAGTLTGAVDGLAIGRELGPVLVGVVASARAGSAIAAEIGTMKVTEQIDAMRSLAVSPIHYLVAPRMAAFIIMVPLLCVVSDTIGLVGGYVVAVWQGVPPASFGDSIRTYVELRDFGMGVVKTIVFAIIIVVVSCHQGLRTTGGATGVGRSTTNAVVLSIVLIYISDFLMAYLMFGTPTNL